VKYGQSALIGQKLFQYSTENNFCHIKRYDAIDRLPAFEKAIQSLLKIEFYCAGIKVSSQLPLPGRVANYVLPKSPFGGQKVQLSGSTNPLKDATTAPTFATFCQSF
jgi:hypothetical protein